MLLRKDNGLGWLSVCLGVGALTSGCGLGSGEEGSYRDLFDGELSPWEVDEERASTDSEDTESEDTDVDPDTGERSDTDEASDTDESTDGEGPRSETDSDGDPGETDTSDETDAEPPNAVGAEDPDDDRDVSGLPAAVDPPEPEPEPDTGADLIVGIQTSSFDPTLEGFQTHLECAGVPFEAALSEVAVPGAQIRLLTAMCDGWIAFGDTSNQEVVTFNMLTQSYGPMWAFTDAPNALRYDPGTDRLYAGVGSQLHIYDLGEGVARSVDMVNSVLSVAPAPDDQLWVSVDQNSLLRMNPQNGEALHLMQDVYQPEDVHYSMPLGLLYTSRSNSRFWQVAEDGGSATPVPSSDYACSNYQQSAMSRDGLHVAVACAAGNGNGYNIRDFLLEEMAFGGTWDTGAYPRQVAFTPDSRSVAATNGRNLFLFDEADAVALRMESIACDFAQEERLAISEDVAPGVVVASNCADAAQLQYMAFAPRPEPEPEPEPEPIRETGEELVLGSDSSTIDVSVGGFDTGHLDCAGAPFSTEPGDLALTTGAFTGLVAFCDGWVALADRENAEVTTFNVLSEAAGPTISLSEAPRSVEYDAETDVLYVRLDTSVEAYSLSTGARTRFEFAGSVAGLAPAPDSRLWVSLDDDLGLVLMDTAAGQALRWHALVPSDLAYAPQSRSLLPGYDYLGRLLVFSEDFWEMEQLPLSDFHCSNYSDAAISPDGAHLGIACGDGNGPGYTIHDYQVSSGNWEIEWQVGSYPRRIAFSPDSLRVATSNGGELVLFDVGAPEPISTTELPCRSTTEGFVTVSRDQGYAAFSAVDCTGNRRLRWQLFD